MTPFINDILGKKTLFKGYQKLSKNEGDKIIFFFKSISNIQKSFALVRRRYFWGRRGLHLGHGEKWAI